MSKVIPFKDPGNYKAAILAVACDQGHGNMSKVIIDSLNANPLVANKLKKLSKKAIKN